MFAYCGNNPIVRVDTSGKFFNTICGAVIGGIVAAITCEGNESPGDAFIRGAVTGAVAGLGLDICAATGGIGGLIIVGIAGAGSGVLDTFWQRKNEGKSATVGEVITNGVIGGGLNLLFGAAGREAGNVIGKTIRSVGNAIYSNFMNSITNRAGNIVMNKVVRETVKNSAYSTVQAGAAKVYSLIMSKMMED